ncbi:DUF805 domain-containing protein [Flavobacterium sp.]|uniref:DUF805 domain-containing protein n=1 Tax=Flavobacterium sp. TaxID=239 RepID=UPI002627E9D9|nr:DUF805 domain-containing protein [Flavobacterium sp.]
MFENYANFSGRARRSEYWYYMLMNGIIILAWAILSAMVSSVSEVFADIFVGVLALYFLIIIIPSFAVIVRRLHDIDKSGWYYLVRFIPIVGSIWLLILFCTEGTNGHNSYGQDPKILYDEINEIGQEFEN